MVRGNKVFLEFGINSCIAILFIINKVDNNIKVIINVNYIKNANFFNIISQVEVLPSFFFGVGRRNRAKIFLSLFILLVKTVLFFFFF